MAVKCNIAKVVLDRLAYVYWRIGKYDTTSLLLNNYIEYLACPAVNVVPCDSEVLPCKEEVITYNCTFKVLRISYSIPEPNPDFDIIFYLGEEDFVNGTTDLKFEWYYNPNHFEAVGDVEGSRIKLKLLPGKDLNSLSTRLNIAVTSDDGCLSIKQCYFVLGVMQCNLSYAPCFGPASLLITKASSTVATLTWDNGEIPGNPNSLSQIAYYRRKDTAGPFIDTGFTPANPLATSVTTTNSPTIDPNVVYEFKVEANCTQNGPIPNDGGVQEYIIYDCAGGSVTVTTTTESSNISISFGGSLNVQRVFFTLIKDSDSSVVVSSREVYVNSGVAATSESNLEPDTAYHWNWVMVNELNGADVRSSDAEQLGAACGPENFTTDNVICNPVTSLTVNVIP